VRRRLAVVTTVYNGERYLTESLLSCIEQKEPDLLHVVIDDGSTDGTAGLLADYAVHRPNVIRLHFPENHGSAFGFNRGVEAAGEVDWILRLDSDDRMSPKYCLEILREAARHPSLEVIFSPCRHIGNRTDVYRFPRYESATITELCPIPGQAAFRRDLWELIGGLDETMRSGEDWDGFIRMDRAKGGLNVRQLQAPLWQYRMHDGPRASAFVMRETERLREYWRGHTKETVLARSRSWAAWQAEQLAAC
jgi:glycosyltransferase involved in cell wall biosynthesis